MRQEITDALIKAFDSTLPNYTVTCMVNRRPPPTSRPKEWESRHLPRSKFDPNLYEYVYSWRIPPKKEDWDKYIFMTSVAEPKEKDMDEFECVVCMEEMKKPIELSQCKHRFCEECISEYFALKPACPVCNTVYGTLYGNQPTDGEAKIFKDKRSLPGYETYGTYIISYEFPDGKQAEGHPNPGKPYKGIERRAFIPDNEEGRTILHMLETAFKQRLTFTIGTSRTTGKEGIITWNDIHHKTSREGGPERFGYPDKEYLTRVREELAAKGILH